MLSFQTLDVYQCSIDLLVVTQRVLEQLPGGQATLADQLRRAAMSIPLNIAEAQGRTAAGDRRRAYAIARGSAMECVAVLDVSVAMGLVGKGLQEEAGGLLERIVAMLTKLCR